MLKEHLFQQTKFILASKSFIVKKQTYHLKSDMSVFIYNLFIGKIL